MKMLMCVGCKTEKERKHFKRLATLAQTRGWLRNPLVSKRLTYFGKECNECYKQTIRKDRDLTPAELERRLKNEEMNPMVIEARLAKRREQGIKNKSVVASRTMKAYWKAKRSEKSNNKER